MGSDARGTDLRARLAGVACLARATAYTSPAHAFRTLADDPGRGLSAPATWATATETWYLHVGTLPAAEAGLLEVAARDAFRTWEAEPCTTLRGNYRGLSGPPMTGDGRNTIGLMESGWVESGLPASSAATTEVVLRRADDGTATIVEFDSYLNWESYQFSFDVGSAEQLNLRGVLVHEVAHAWGLAHPCGDVLGAVAAVARRGGPAMSERVEEVEPGSHIQRLQTSLGVTAFSHAIVARRTTCDSSICSCRE